MSKAESKEIVNWKDDMQKDAVKTAKTERPTSSVISLKGGIMTYQDEPIPDNKLECVVIAVSFARTCFMRPYDADDKDPPECFSNAIDQADLIPHPNVPEPFAKICNEKACEWAVFGTALQGKGPRCKTRRKMVIIPVSALQDAGEAEVAMLTIPPTSGKNWSTYANKIATGAGLPPWGVKTMIIVKPHAKKQFEVTFETTGPVADEGILAAIHSRIDSAETALLQPYIYDQEEEEEEGDPNAKY